MTALLLLRRFWPAIPMLALLVALLVTRGTLADVKDDRERIRSAFNQTVADYRAARELARRDDELNRIRVGKQQAAISQEVTNEYQDRIAALRADFAERVRLATARANPGGGGTAGVSGISPPTGGTAEGARDPGLPSRQALIASEQAEQLVALQNWVKRQATVDVSGGQE